ncbi:MAG: acyltransferase [Alphaproteobacteria bacterium]|nr:acyltransferase [Alphaproteobacteria bacterium]
MDRLAHASHPGRIDWVDTAKGFCIVMVVMMHSTLGVGAATSGEGWMHAAVTFAKPFRMPDFFLISGLFLARVIDRDWRDYIDRKVIHFAYFYVLWVTIQFAFKAPMFAADLGWRAVGFTYLEAFVEPFGTLWFIYLLPVFFVVVKLTRRVPPLAIWLVGAALEIAPIHTGWTMPDEFASRFVYFYSGYLLAPRIFEFAAQVQARPRAAMAALAVWAPVNGILVFGGYADLPFVSLGLGMLGAAAVVAAAALLAQIDWMRWLRYLGQQSIVIYLAFFLPMAATRIVLIKTGIVPDIGTMSAIVTIAGVTGALVWYWAVRNTPFRFLFERPAWARLKPLRVRAMQPAE